MDFKLRLEGKKLSVDINSLRYFSGDRKAKILKAAEYLMAVFNSEEFRHWFLMLKFRGKDEGTNQMLYDRLMSGETDYGGPDSDIDIDLTYYRSWWSRVLGYGLPGTIRTWINGKYLDGMDTEELTGHLAHEYFHKFGLDDDYGSMSVPYQVGNLVERLAYTHTQIGLSPLS